MHIVELWYFLLMGSRQQQFWCCALLIVSTISIILVIWIPRVAELPDSYFPLVLHGSLGSWSDGISLCSWEDRGKHVHHVCVSRSHSKALTSTPLVGSGVGVCLPPSTPTLAWHQWWQNWLGTGGQANINVLIVQHPVGRLVTGWTNDNHSKTFQHYVTGALASGQTRWLPLTTICAPCDITYNYIMRAETLEWDIAVIANKLYVEINWVQRNVLELMNIPTLEVLKKYIYELDDITIQQLLQHYHTDLDMFGYSIINRTAHCLLNVNNKTRCC